MPAELVKPYVKSNTAASGGKFTAQEQKILGEHLPGADTFWAWDYCRRLCQALLDTLLPSDSWEPLLGMEVSPLAIKDVVRELERCQYWFPILSNFNQKRNAVPGAQRKWGKAIKDAIAPRKISPFFSWQSGESGQHEFTLRVLTKLSEALVQQTTAA